MQRLKDESQAVDGISAGNVFQHENLKEFSYALRSDIKSDQQKNNEAVLESTGKSTSEKIGVKKDQKLFKVTRRRRMSTIRKSKIERLKSDEIIRKQITENLHGVFVVDGEEHAFAKTSCFCLGNTHTIRKICVVVMINKWFDRFITFCILANSLLLATKEYRENYDGAYESSWNKTLEYTDLVFTLIFLIECVVKIIGMGFYKHDRSYLKDPFNWIDFIIVIVSLVSLTPIANHESFKAFRTARVLRPLRSVQSFDRMKTLIEAVIKSVPELFNVCIALSFLFAIFAIFGVNFFVGQQYQFCRLSQELIDDGVSEPHWPIDPDAAYLCSSDEMCTGFPNNLGEGRYCGNVYREYGLDPKEVDDVYNNEIIQYNIVNFDNVLKALFLVFQVITLEGWSQQMYNYQDTVSYVTSSIFFVCVVILGAFVTVNLVLASIMNQFLVLEKNMPLPNSVCLYAVIHKEIEPKEKDDEPPVPFLQGSGASSSIRYLVLHPIQIRNKYKSFQFFITDNIHSAVLSMNTQLGHEGNRKKKKVTLIISEKQVRDFKYNKRAQSDQIGKTLEIPMRDGKQQDIKLVERFCLEQIRERDDYQKYEKGFHDLIALAAMQNQKILTAIKTVFANSAKSPSPLDTSNSKKSLSSSNIQQLQLSYQIKNLLKKRMNTLPSAEIPLSPQHFVMGGAEEEKQSSHGAGPGDRGNLSVIQDQNEEQREEEDEKDDDSKIYNGSDAPDKDDGEVPVPATDRALIERQSEINLLPSLHGQTAMRFHAVEEFKHLEEQVLHWDGNSSGVQSNDPPQSRMSGLSRSNNDAVKLYQVNANSPVQDVQEQQNDSQTMNMSSPSPERRQGDSQFMNQSIGMRMNDSSQKGLINDAQSSFHDYSNTEQVQIKRGSETSNMSLVLQGTAHQNTPAVVERADKNQIFGFFYNIVISVTFNFLIYCLILANTITLALYRYDQSEEQTQILAALDVFFVWVFTVEMLMKILGLGLKNYLRDKFNIFDAAIVILSLADFSIYASGVIDSEGDDSDIFSAFRALRLLRVIKLARQWKEFQKILTKTMKSLGEVSNFTLILFLFMFIMALLGMELFAYSVVFDADGEIILGQERIQAYYESGQELNWPRENFNNVFNSLVTIFIVIVGEDWNQVMSLYVRALGYESSVGWQVARMFFLIVMIGGNIILLALFTSLLLKNFDASSLNLNQEEADSKDEVPSSTADSKLKKKNFRRTLYQSQEEVEEEEEEFDCRKFCSREACKARYQRLADSFVQIFGGEQALQRRKQSKKKDPKASASPMSGNAAMVAQSAQQSQVNQEQYPVEAANDDEEFEEKQRPNALIHYDYDQIKEFEKKRPSKKKMKTPLKGKSLYIFSEENCVRKKTDTITSHWLFESMIIVLIVISTLTLAFEDPLQDPTSQTMKTIGIIDITMTIIFTTEALLKIITLGFVFNGRHSYLRNTWNILDFIIVIFALVSLAITDSNIQFVKVLRVARILRPLRLIQRQQGLKVAVRSLLKAFPQIMRLQIVVFFVMFMISILLTTLLSGKMYRCDLEHTTWSTGLSANSVATKWDCLNLGGEWVSPPMNFNNTLRGMLTLFIFQSREGWIGLMWDSVDAVGVNRQPERGFNQVYVIVFMILVVLLCLLFVNMFVGIVIETYSNQKENISFNNMIDETERSWLKLQVMTYQVKPLPLIKSNNCLRYSCIYVTRHRYFDRFIMICICLNTLVLAFNWFDQPTFVTDLTEALNYVFMTVFTLEAIIKIIALKSTYFHNNWNVFDFFIVVFTVGILLLKLVQINVEFGSGATILRALRIGRILRLLKRSKGLQVIFLTLVDSGASLGSLGLLLIILFFMFAIIGRSLFSFAPIIGEINYELNEHANFRDFWTSFLLLMRCATGEAWHMIMFDLARGYSATNQCRENETYQTMMENGGEPFGCGSPMSSYFFFTLFHILVSQIFLNLFIAIIIDAFVHQADHFKLPIQPYALNDYQEIWQKYDPGATGFIPIKQLEQFIVDLASCNKEARKLVIFRKDILKDPRKLRVFLCRLNIPTYYQMTKVHFTDTLQQLVDRKNQYQFWTEKRSDEEKAQARVLAMFTKYGSEFYNFMKPSNNDQRKVVVKWNLIIQQMSVLHPKIELVNQMQFYALKMHNNLAIYADTDSNICMSHEERVKTEIKLLKTVNREGALTEYRNRMSETLGSGNATLHGEFRDNGVNDHQSVDSNEDRHSGDEASREGIDNANSNQAQLPAARTNPIDMMINGGPPSNGQGMLHQEPPLQQLEESMRAQEGIDRPRDINLRTTKHYYYGMAIYEAYKRWKKAKIAAEVAAEIASKNGERNDNDIVSRSACREEDHEEVAAFGSQQGIDQRAKSTNVLVSQKKIGSCNSQEFILQGNSSSQGLLPKSNNSLSTNSKMVQEEINRMQQTPLEDIQKTKSAMLSVREASEGVAESSSPSKFKKSMVSSEPQHDQ